MAESPARQERALRGCRAFHRRGDARAKLFQWQLTTIAVVFGGVVANLLLSDQEKIGLCAAKHACGIPPGEVDSLAAWQKVVQALLVVASYFTFVRFAQQMIGFYRLRVAKLSLDIGSDVSEIGENERSAASGLCASGPIPKAGVLLCFSWSGRSYAAISRVRQSG